MADPYAVRAYGPTIQVSRQLLDDSAGIVDAVDAIMREAAEEMRLTMLYGPRLGPGRREFDKYRKRRRTVTAHRHRDRRCDCDRWD